MKLKKARILVQGIVQGVGFRPNVYRLANARKLNGYVRNLGNVVEIIVEGSEDNIKSFSNEIKTKKPPISKVDSVKIDWLDDGSSSRFNGFQILESSSNFSGSSVIPPDVATCNSCLDEVMKNGDRRFQYPFIACTDCGPRFTVIVHPWMYFPCVLIVKKNMKTLKTGVTMLKHLVARSADLKFPFMVKRR